MNRITIPADGCQKICLQGYDDSVLVVGPDYRDSDGGDEVIPPDGFLGLVNERRWSLANLLDPRPNCIYKSSPRAPDGLSVGGAICRCRA